MVHLVICEVGSVHLPSCFPDCGVKQDDGYVPASCTALAAPAEFLRGGPVFLSAHHVCLHGRWLIIHMWDFW